MRFSTEQAWLGNRGAIPGWDGAPFFIPGGFSWEMKLLVRW